MTKLSDTLENKKCEKCEKPLAECKCNKVISHKSQDKENNIDDPTVSHQRKGSLIHPDLQIGDERSMLFDVSATKSILELLKLKKPKQSQTG